MIYYLCLDDNTPSGGRRILYRHVDILNANGIEAAIGHQSDVRLTWFENQTRVENITGLAFGDTDVLVIPETWGPNLHTIAPDMPFVIFNQNAYYTWNGYTMREAETPYQSENLLGVMVVSDDSRDYLRYAFPHLEPYRIHNSIAPIFRYQSAKDQRIACMPRKHADELCQVLNLCKWRGELAGWTVDLIDNATQEDVARRLRRAAVFLSTGYPEGSPMPPLEALASGCVVVGYLGKGGNEYTDLGCIIPVDDSDVIGLAGSLAWTLAHLTQYDTEAASKAALERYSAERETADVLGFWEKTL